MIIAQDIQGISIYADVCLGMFQVAAMRVLTLQLRNEEPVQLVTSEQKIYKCVVAFTILFWLGVIIDMIISITCENRADKSGKELSCLDGSHQKAQYINGTFFLILFVLMTITAIPLCRVLSYATGFNRTLSSNVKWLTSIFALFTFAFMSRAIYDFATRMNGSFLTTFLGLALPLIWDFLPIFLMSLFHLRDVRIERRLQTKSPHQTWETGSDGSSIVIGMKGSHKEGHVSVASKDINTHSSVDPISVVEEYSNDDEFSNKKSSKLSAEDLRRRSGDQLERAFDRLAPGRSGLFDSTNARSI